MSYAERHTVSVTTDASGDATAYTPVVTGRLINVVYTKDDFAAGVDFTITAESSGIGIWTELSVDASETVAPLQHGYNQVGVVQDTAGDVWEVPIYLAEERVKIVVANGGNVKSGTIVVIVA